MLQKTFVFVILMTCISFAFSLTVPLNFEFSGGMAPKGTAPWLTATFENVSANTVRLTMSTANLVVSEFVGEWYFNFNPSLNPSNLTFVYKSGVSAATISKGANAFKADGDGYFDFKFAFTANTFTKVLTSVYEITYTSAITDASFNYKSSPDPMFASTGSYTSAAHIQGIGTGATGSGWIGENDSVRISAE